MSITTRIIAGTTVAVRSYLRCRLGQWQTVKSHSRRRRRHQGYQELAEKLAEIGVKDSEPNIRNKIARSSFTAVFFVQCREAIGCHQVRLHDD